MSDRLQASSQIKINGGLILKNSKLTLGKSSVLFRINNDLSNAKSPEVMRHCNAENELFIVLSGSCHMDIEDKEFFLEKGDSILVPQGKFHSTPSVSEDFVNFVLPFSVEYKKDSSSEPRFFEVQRIFFDEKIPEICLGIRKEVSEKKPFWFESVEARYFIILSELFRSISGEKRSLDLSRTSRGRLDIIDDFFEKSAVSDGTATDLAKAVHLSPRQISRTLIKNYGMNFSEKKHRARMDRAAYLLRTTALSVSKISEEVGYISENSFFKAFKRLYGTTPAKYRKDLQK